ncbi:arrestin domain containing protein [Sporothrix schenckii 1099-18]|uniref:Arrestin domain containing protein n=1 Tax=Sporothrix schenckii 1099-18 TaxID=1397361 RepID=A0A0F2MM84_SPOSC|nr:arrestin domain containing protein [Sporothrix schenckii 1099-18]KJR89296.1 arrestin domain containing protein [Sporothrix schenckii 1099-18]
MPPPTADFRHNPASASTAATANPVRTTSNLRRVQSRAVHGTVLYTPRSGIERRPRPPGPTFPTPLIRARPRRPHTIHIVSYPAGYIPSELRGVLDPDHVKKGNTSRPSRGRTKTLQRRASGQGNSAKRQFDKIIAAFSALPAPAAALANPLPLGQIQSTSEQSQIPPPTEVSIALARTNSSSGSSRPNSFLNLSGRLSLTQTRSVDSTRPPLTAPIPAIELRSPANSASAIPQSLHQGENTNLNMLSTQSNSNRNSLISVRSVKNIISSSVAEVNEKPIASAGGMSFDIALTEPHLFLYGFDHDTRTERRPVQNTPAILRGTLRLKVTKNVKIRAITIKLQARGRTKWPEGLPFDREVRHEDISLRNSNQTFFNAMHGSWSTPYGNNCNIIKTQKELPSDNSLAVTFDKFGSSGNESQLALPGMSSRDIKRLSLQQVQARSFGKEDSPIVQATQAKGYKVFEPGCYEYTFDFPIDHHQLESINLPFASVNWWLEGSIERAGAFKPNLHGVKDVSIIRVPDQLSLETVEPISISRSWEDQLFYDIVISGKSFPIGSKIPIAFKLTPLAKVQLHKIKVFITESAEYWSSNRRVTRKDPGRKILLFEKVAGKPLDEQYASSDINFTAGGELTPEERADARNSAIRRRELEARRLQQPAEPVPETGENLLGDLDLGLEAYWGSTELEMNVQVPTCEQMARDPALRLHPDVSWRNAHVYHWIKIVLRISKLDPEDPAGVRRRHFEISIDSPFSILNCRATQTNTSLPRYTGMDMSLADSCVESACGCSDAMDKCRPSAPSPSASSRTGSFPFGSELNVGMMPAPPQAAHLHSGTHQPGSSGDSMSVYTPPTSNRGSQMSLASATRDSMMAHAAEIGAASRASQAHTAQTEQEAFENPRPIHLLRVPSYAPPAFDADSSPPLAADIMTPPPNYDLIVGTPSVDGLADYFSRLANYDDDHQGSGSDGTVTDTDTINIGLDDDDSDSSEGDNVPARISSRGGRVNVPHPNTPGGLQRAPSRSMDIQRPMVPFNLHMANHAVRHAAQ